MPESDRIEAGSYQLSADWQIELPVDYQYRLEDGDLCLWRKGMTVWAAIWHNDYDESVRQRYLRLKNQCPREAFDMVESSDGRHFRIGFRLADSDDDSRFAFYGYVVSECGHVKIAMFFSDPNEIETAKALWRSVTVVSKYAYPGVSG